MYIIHVGILFLAKISSYAVYQSTINDKEMIVGKIHVPVINTCMVAVLESSYYPHVVQSTG